VETELKPCPFCGGEAAFKQTGPNELTLRCVGVQPSGLLGCGPKYVQKGGIRFTLEWLTGKMTENWNRRASDAAHASLVEENEGLERDRAEQWRLRREAESDRDMEKAVALSLKLERDDLLSKLSDIMDGWDFWDAAPTDREPPRAAIRRARAALSASLEGSTDAD
jgi:predicted ATPase